MAYNYNEQTNTSNFSIPFKIANDCPQENREIIYRIIINLKNNFLKKQNIYNRLTYIETI